MDEQTQSPMSGMSGGQPMGGKGKNIGMAIIAYIIFFIPLLTDAKNDPFVKFHVKQGFVLFLSWIVVMLLGWVPFVWMFTWILNIFLLILMVMGIINASQGNEKELPLIGQFAKSFNF